MGERLNEAVLLASRCSTIPLPKGIPGSTRDPGSATFIPKQMRNTERSIEKIFYSEPDGEQQGSGLPCLLAAVGVKLDPAVGAGAGAAAAAPAGFAEVRGAVLVGSAGAAGGRGSARAAGPRRLSLLLCAASRAAHRTLALFFRIYACFPCGVLSLTPFLLPLLLRPPPDCRQAVLSYREDPASCRTTRK